MTLLGSELYGDCSKRILIPKNFEAKSIKETKSFFFRNNMFAKCYLQMKLVCNICNMLFTEPKNAEKSKYVDPPWTERGIF